MLLLATYALYVYHFVNKCKHIKETHHFLHYTGKLPEKICKILEVQIPRLTRINDFLHTLTNMCKYGYHIITGSVLHIITLNVHNNY